MNEQVKLIGERIRDLREISELSVEEVADYLGISVEKYISYENGESDMSISIVYELANKFGVAFTSILSGDAPKLSVYQHVKAGQGLGVKRREQYEYKNLAFNFANKSLEPFLVTVPPFDGEDPNSIQLESHPGQEFNYCLKGRVCIIINGKEIVLDEGDSLIFDSKHWHGLRALDGKEALFLAIVTD
ncbi:MAG: helix-turn-helix transcriptional regulator [Clostridia bacterium]|nr:helix-turn-helix transcriptional regulator [Clostridia bacterium]